MNRRWFRIPASDGTIPVLGAAVLWGTVGPAQVWADTGDDPVALGGARLLLGGLVLAVVAARGRTPLRQLFARDVWPWLLLAALATAVFQAGFMFSVSRTGAALATAVTLGVAPVATGLFARVVHRDRLDVRWVGGTVAAILGCVLLLAPGGESVSTAGVLLGLVAGVCYGLYTVGAKQVSSRGVDMPAAVAATLLVGGLALTPQYAVHAGDMVTVDSLLLIAWLGLAATALAYMLFVTGLGRTTASRAGTLSLAEPLVAAALGLLALGERMSGTASVGMALLLAGLVVVSLPTRRESRPTTPVSREPVPDPPGNVLRQPFERASRDVETTGGGAQ